MQMQSAQRAVTASGVTPLRKSRIIMDGAAIQILSSGIYSNKIGSLVRECYSNAHDSHTASGNPAAPVITLPNHMDLVFSIKDEGLGMSLDSVLNALDYFSSDKRDDNLGIGYFGLGFKSPYSYTDQFTVISTYQGTRYIVSAVMGEDGIPAPMLLSEELTDQPNGVEVRIPVQSTDCGAFAREVASQLKLFEPRPVILGGTVEWPDANIPEAAVVVPDQGYVTSLNKWRSFSGGLTARIGPVEFPVDRKQLRDSGVIDSALETFLERVEGCLFCGIGEVDPQPSREALQYTKHSTKALLAKITALKEGYEAALASQIEASPSVYEANRLVASWKNKFGHNPELFKSLTYKGNPVPGIWRAPENTAAKLFSFKPRQSQEKYIFNSAAYTTVFHVDSKVALFIDDLPGPSHRQSARIKLFMQDSAHDYDNIVVLRGCLPADIPEFAGFPEEDLFYLSECPPPAPKTRAYTGKGKQTKLAPAAYRKIDRGIQWVHNIPCADISDTCHTIPTSGYYVVSKSGNLDHQTQRRLACTDVLPGDVYVINTTDARGIVKDTPLLPFDAAFDAALKANMAGLKAKVTAYAESPTVDYNWQVLFDALVVLGVTPKSSPKPLWKFFNIFYQHRNSKHTRQTVFLTTLEEFSDLFLAKQKGACARNDALIAARYASEPLLCCMLNRSGLPYNPTARADIIADIHKKYFS